MQRWLPRGKFCEKKVFGVVLLKIITPSKHKTNDTFHVQSNSVGIFREVFSYLLRVTGVGSLKLAYRLETVTVLDSEMCI